MGRKKKLKFKLKCGEEFETEMDNYRGLVLI